MQGWLIYNEEDIEKNKRYIDFYYEESKALEIKIELINSYDLAYGIKDNMHYITYKNKIKEKPDFCIVRCINPLLSKQLEYLDIPVFNNSFVSEICNDKAKTYQYVGKLGINMVDSRFCKGYQIPELLEQLNKPTVIKSVSGHGGSEVFLVADESDLDHETMITCLKEKDVVLQPLTGTRREDLRVYVLGNKILAAILRKGKDGFKSNFSLGGEVKEYHLNEEERKIVNQIIELFDFSLVGIDFIIGDEGELIFNEIEDVVGARMLYQCTNINLVNLYLTFIKNKLRQVD